MLQVSCLFVIFAYASALRIPSSHLLLSSHVTSSTKTPDVIGWDTHKAIDAIPESLVRVIDGNESMRRKFEILCRSAQVIFVIQLFFSLVMSAGEYLQCN